MFDATANTVNNAAKPSVAIDADVPMPEGSGRGGNAKYPWKEMEIGNSFWVPSVNLKSWQTACVKAGKQYERKFIARKFTGPEGQDGIRVWRKA